MVVDVVKEVCWGGKMSSALRRGCRVLCCFQVKRQFGCGDILLKIRVVVEWPMRLRNVA